MDSSDKELIESEAIEETEEASVVEESPAEENAEGAKTERRLPFWLGILVGVAVMAVVAVIAFTLIFRSNTSSTSSELTATERKTNAIMAYVTNYFVGDIPDEDALDAAVEEGVADAVIGSLGDVYAAYYTPEEYKALQESTSGTYGGIGVTIVANDDDRIEVTEISENSPAGEAGVRIGDIIVAADGNRDFETTDELVTLVRGDAGTKVVLTVERDGKEIDISVTREIIETDSVAWEMIEGTSIGYVLIDSFEKVTPKQFNKAIDELTDLGMESLIIDVRWNLGGDYDACVSICDRVLPEGTIMTVKDSKGVSKTETSDAENCIDLPMVLLVNGSSASASEVFAGAIKDYGIATLVGQQTYGKGVVQSIFGLYDGSAIKFTTMEYYTPNGNNLNGVGVEPDIEVALPEDAFDDFYLDVDEDTQLQKAIELLSAG